MAGVGSVCLVGAGPGDPELLTLKALRKLSEAEAIVYDRLVSEAVLNLVPKGATRIDVGKRQGCHPVPQAEINALLLRLARAGRRVVRLKGGDPFTFGRGSEESQFLHRHGIACEVVPGVTAASGCAAALGIPLTHRGLAAGVRYVTGHCRTGSALDLDWQSLADPQTTLVVYMGRAHVAEISRRLVEAGLPSETPAAIVARGTTPAQHHAIATLGTLPQAATQFADDGPVLFIIGAVVDLAPASGLAAWMPAVEPLHAADA